MELGGKLDACRAGTDDAEIEQVSSLNIGKSRLRGFFEA